MIHLIKLQTMQIRTSPIALEEKIRKSEDMLEKLNQNEIQLQVQLNRRA